MQRPARSPLRVTSAGQDNPAAAQGQVISAAISMLHRSLRAPAARAGASRPCCGKSLSRPLAPVRATTEDAVSTNGVVASTGTVAWDELQDIIRMVHSTDIIELELKSKKYTLSLKKKEALHVAQPVVQYISGPPEGYTQQAPAPLPQAPAPAAPSAGLAPPPAPMAPSPVKIEGIEITSPMAGTYYKSAAPGEAAFVKTGDRIKKGQVVGIIEAMKLMNEIESEISGEVVKVLVENGQPVSPGQPIILVRP